MIVPKRQFMMHEFFPEPDEHSSESDYGIIHCLETKDNGLIARQFREASTFLEQYYGIDLFFALISTNPIDRKFHDIVTGLAIIADMFDPDVVASNQTRIKLADEATNNKKSFSFKRKQALKMMQIGRLLEMAQMDQYRANAMLEVQMELAKQALEQRGLEAEQILANCSVYEEIRDVLKPHGLDKKILSDRTLGKYWTFFKSRRESINSGWIQSRQGEIMQSIKLLAEKPELIPNDSERESLKAKLVDALKGDFTAIANVYDEVFMGEGPLSYKK